MTTATANDEDNAAVENENGETAGSSEQAVNGGNAEQNIDSTMLEVRNRRWEELRRRVNRLNDRE